MCGIVGALSLDGSPPLSEAGVLGMLGALRHRGPDEAGVWRCDAAVLGHARLSIVDLTSGLQPLTNEDESLWTVVNGEVFNAIELTRDLRRRGHAFRTRSDSEVILHLYEELGPALLDELNGQYAFALWDDRRQRLLLGRDRLGVRPLFWTVADGVLLFASEIKALLTDPRVHRSVDLQSLEQVFTYWSPLPGNTMFEGIHELPAGHFLVAEPGMDSPVTTPYWDVQFDSPAAPAGLDASAEQLRALLVDATRLRLRADVPVGAYLSGGLDSAAIASIVQNYTSNELQTFSVAFDDSAYDERGFQQAMSKRLGTKHSVIECGWRDIGEVFPEVVWHAETPLLRTAPAPLFLLSALVRRNGLKVVLTGEGADEFLGGYDIFKEALVRRFWARNPDSTLRPKLLGKLYGWLPDLHRGSPAAMQAFFRQSLMETDDVAYSHQLRWRGAARLTRLFSPEVRATLGDYDSRPELDALLRSELASYDTLSKAQYVEAKTFLTPYLLASQGDRVAMAHAVEGRFPFLDHRVVAFAASLPPSLRMAGLNEKSLLKHAVRDLVPAEILHRTKQPYRAPINRAFIGPDAPGYVAELLSPEAVRSAGLFSATAVTRLHDKARASSRLSEADDMALVGVLSTQLWHQAYLSAFAPAKPLDRTDVVHVGRDLPLRQAV
jgi:asparagine synthase (glutamine-hydrolysing)